MIKSTLKRSFLIFKLNSDISFFKKNYFLLEKMIAIFVLLLSTVVFTQTNVPYCTLKGGIKITTGNDCLSSYQYNVENCCFDCLQINPINQSSQIKCGSLYALGFNSCTNISEAAALKACGGGVLRCLCNAGADKSPVTSNGNSLWIMNSLILYGILSHLF